MSVTPRAWSVAAAVTMIAKAMRWRTPYLQTCPVDPVERSFSFLGGPLRRVRPSSASWEDCWKKRYKLMGVPSTATTVVR